MGSRADNKDGSCREVLTGRHAGKWRVQHVHEDEFCRKSRLSRLFPTKTEAKDFLRSLQRGERIERARKDKDLTLGAWFDWLVENDWPESIASATLGSRISRFNKHVRKEWGDVSLLRLDALAIKAFYRGLQESGVGAASVLEIKRDLVRVFNLAVKPYHRVPWSCGNPFTLYVPTPPRRDAVALEPRQAVAAIRSNSLTAKERALLATFLLAGLRLGELMALTRGQLQFDQGLILVDRAVRLDRVGGQGVGLPKGSKKRLAVMSPTLKKILCGVASDLRPDELIWPAKDKDKPRLKRNVYRSWKIILEKTGLPSDMSPHDCRLSHVNWIEKLLPEVSPTTLKEHIGHASGRSVTEINYTRPLSDSQEILRRGLENIVGFN